MNDKDKTNKGSTKPTYSELETALEYERHVKENYRELMRASIGRFEKAESALARVRGLLQRQQDALCGMIATFESGDHADKSSEFGICSTGMCAICDAQEALDAAMSVIQIPTDAKSVNNRPENDQYLKASGFPHKTIPVSVLADIDEENS